MPGCDGIAIRTSRFLSTQRPMVPHTSWSGAPVGPCSNSGATNSGNGGFLKWGYPQFWMVYLDNPNLKWMTGGSPIIQSSIPGTSPKEVRGWFICPVMFYITQLKRGYFISRYGCFGDVKPIPNSWVINPKP